MRFDEKELRVMMKKMLALALILKKGGFTVNKANKYLLVKSTYRVCLIWYFI
jgi:hypothetical protein